LSWTEDYKWCVNGKYDDEEYNQSSEYQISLDWITSALNSIKDDPNAPYGKEKIDCIIDAYKSLAKNERGDIVSKSSKKGDSPKYVTNPFTDEDVPVYSEEEAELLEELYSIEDQIAELEDWLDAEDDMDERNHLRRDIDKLFQTYDVIKKRLDELRDEDNWSEVREKQKKLAAEKEKKKKAAKKKKDAAKAKEKKRIEKRNAERLEMLGGEEELNNIANDLFN
jgi:predicted  nucleic acid-binding Zn-ribbon protein